MLCEHGSARYAHERSRENPVRFYGLPPADDSMGDRKNTVTSWAGPFMALPFSGPAAQESAIVALPASGADHLVYVERPSAASRTIPPAPSARYTEIKQVCRFIEFSGGAVVLIGTHLAGK